MRIISKFLHRYITVKNEANDYRERSATTVPAGHGKALSIIDFAMETTKQ